MKVPQQVLTAAKLKLVLLFLGVTAMQAAGGPCQQPLSTEQVAWAVADFNGDDVADLARVSVRSESRVDLFRPCAGSIPRLFSLLPQNGLSLRVRDVDQDQDLDLVLRDRFASRTVGIWLNDGHGRFSEAGQSRFANAGVDVPRAGKHRSPKRAIAQVFFSRSFPALFAVARDASYEPTSELPHSVSTEPAAARPQRSVRGRAPPSLSL